MERDHQYLTVVVCRGRGDVCAETEAGRNKVGGGTEVGLAVVTRWPKRHKASNVTQVYFLFIKLLKAGTPFTGSLGAQDPSSWWSHHPLDPHFHLNPGENRSWGCPCVCKTLEKVWLASAPIPLARAHDIPLLLVFRTCIFSSEVSAFSIIKVMSFCVRLINVILKLIKLLILNHQCMMGYCTIYSDFYWVLTFLFIKENRQYLYSFVCMSFLLCKWINALPT